VDRILAEFGADEAAERSVLRMLRAHKAGRKVGASASKGGRAGQAGHGLGQGQRSRADSPNEPTEVASVRTRVGSAVGDATSVVSDCESSGSGLGLGVSLGAGAGRGSGAPSPVPSSSPSSSAAPSPASAARAAHIRTILGETSDDSGADEAEETGKDADDDAADAAAWSYLSSQIGDDGLTAGCGMFIMESILSCGGQVVPPKGFLRRVYASVRAAGGVCVADEVQTGFGRAGQWMWAFQAQGEDVVPDIVTLGKPLGSGFPVSAVVTTPEIARSFANGMEYFNTFGGNPVAGAVALATLDVLEREGLQRNAKEVGEVFLEGFRELERKYSSPGPVCIGSVRGMGLMVGLEFVKDR
jgi:hypothetical protein